MDIELKLADLTKTVRDHREVLLTEEAAKNALVMPFIQALGYNVFNPAEVIPEFTADVGTKKGEKVDYAICTEGQVSFLIECKPANANLTINNASQLFRYFTVTDARVAILTNGVIFKFFSDLDTPNKMDEKPFYILDLENVRSTDLKTLSTFAKDKFDIERVVAEAGNLKLQTLVANALSEEFDKPSDEFVRLIAGRVHNGRITTAVRDTFASVISLSINAMIREKVNERLTSALRASNPAEAVAGDTNGGTSDDVIETSDSEIEGFNIIRAICSRMVDPNRVIIRDAKSYCAVLLDDNNRKSIARMHFNSNTSRYFGTFAGKEETRHSVNAPVEIYKFEKAILDRIKELEA